MARGSAAGRGRVTIWKQRTSRNGTAVLAYTTWASQGDGFPEAAVVGVMAGDDLNVWSWATNNTVPLDVPFWIVCRGWSKRIMQASHSLDLRDVEWTASLSRLVDLSRTCYGSERLATGHLELADPDLQARAVGLLEGVAVA